jgi:hypothetical protein
LVKKKQTKPKDVSIRAGKDRRGKVAASSETSDDEVMARLAKIGEELGKGWQSEKSAVETLSEMRR